jgi:hypothetical protein
MFAKLYGRAKDQEALASVLDGVGTIEEGRRRGRAGRPAADRGARHVRPRDGGGAEQAKAAAAHPVPVLEPGVRKDNDNIPQISKAQIDLMVNAFAADFARVASLQYTNSVGNARMRWLGINEAHHALSHEGTTSSRRRRS